MEDLEGTPAELHAKGMELMQEGALDDAIHHFATALEHARDDGIPESSPELAAYYLAYADALLKQHEEGDTEFGEENEEDLEMFSDAWNMFDLARLGFEKRRAERPDDHEAGELLVLCHLRMGDHKQWDEDFNGAKAEYEKSLKYCEEHCAAEESKKAEILVQMGSCLQNLEKNDEALKVLEQCLGCLKAHLAKCSGADEKERFAAICEEVEEKIKECKPDATKAGAKAVAEARDTVKAKEGDAGFAKPTLDGPVQEVQAVKRKQKADDPPAKVQKGA